MTRIVPVSATYHADTEMRIVSLLPAATEWVCAFGVRSELVGRSHACDRPESVEEVPALTRSKISDHGDSRAIDREVGERLEDGLSLYEVYTDRLEELAPDVVITQDQCEVCAVAREEVAGYLDELVGGEVELVNFAPSTLKQAFDGALRVGRAIGRLDAAMERLARGERRLARLRDELGVRRDGAMAGADRPTVCCVEWIDPPMVAGHWVPDLVAQAGGKPVLVEEAGLRSRRVEWEEIRAADPDVLALVPCGFSVEEARADLSYLRDRPGWDRLRAVREGRVVLFDGRRYFNRPGPGLYRSAELLAASLHPDRVSGAIRAPGADEAVRVTGAPVV